MFDAVTRHNFLLQVADIVQILLLNNLSGIFLAEDTLLQILKYSNQKFKKKRELCNIML